MAKDEKNDTYKPYTIGIGVVIGIVVVCLIAYGVFSEDFRQFFEKHGFIKQRNGRSSFVPRPRLGSFSRPKFQEATDALLAPAGNRLTSL